MFEFILMQKGQYHFLFKNIKMMTLGIAIIVFVAVFLDTFYNVFIMDSMPLRLK